MGRQGVHGAPRAGPKLCAAARDALAIAECPGGEPEVPMPRGIERRGSVRAGAGATALIIVRSPATHNSRELREAHTLRKLGYRPQILGVVSDEVRERSATIQGFPVTRVAPSSPLSWVRTRLGRAGQAGAGGRGGSGSSSRGSGAGAPRSIAVRAHRWFRTIDFYRRAVAMVREQRPALIHCNDYNTMWVGVAARLIGGTAVIYDSHELWADRNGRPEPRWWLLACEFLFVRCAHRTITASPGYAEIMARRYRIQPPRVIRNIPANGLVDRSPLPETGAGSTDPPDGRRRARCRLRGSADQRSRAGDLDTSAGAGARCTAAVRGTVTRRLPSRACRSGTPRRGRRPAGASRGRPARAPPRCDPRGERRAGADPAHMPLLQAEPAQQALRVRHGGNSGAGQRPALDQPPHQRAPDRPGRSTRRGRGCRSEAERVGAT